VAAAVRPVAGRVVLVTGRPDAYRRFGLPMLPDRWPDAGALGGIGTALTHAGTERALVVACDLPFLTSALLAFLAGLDPAADVTLCETEAEGIHPLCAVYSRRCLPHIERRVAEGRLKVAGFFDAVTVRAVGETEMRAHGFTPDLLANLNTPEEYERARRALAGEAGREGKPA
jgi:molybdopterin-guanine dinucleotide biosynthesis protein A